MVHNLRHGTGDRAPLGEDRQQGSGSVHFFYETLESPYCQKEEIPIKRTGNLFNIIISDKNLETAIYEVNKNHHWHGNHRPNRCTAWVEETKAERVRELRKIIVNGFVPKKPRVTVRWDASAQKYRTISEPIQYPDQYIHHALIQVLQSVMMRGMDFYCCGSIRDRGTDKARKAIQGWMSSDIKGTKYELCGDIYHFYDSLKPEVVMERMKHLIKDYRTLDLVWRIVKDGIMIGAYTSQWFANTVLQPLDRLIRNSGYCKHYVRYMDNLTILGANKRNLRKLRKLIESWLNEHGLKLKGDYQIFPTSKRMPDAVGYRYGRGYTLIRKHTLLRIKRALGRYRKKVKKGSRVPVSMAVSVISRAGLLSHCNNHNIYMRLYKGDRVMRKLKCIVRSWQRNNGLTWDMYMKLRAMKREMG